MTNITRKRIWPVSLVATLGVIAMLAILAAVMWPTGAAQAQGLPPAFPPGKPTGLTATVDGATQISLSWTHVGVAADRYDVERKSGSGTFTNVGMPTGTSFTNSGLTASTTYTYRVRAVNAAGNGSFSDEMTGTTTATGTEPDPDPPDTTAGAMLKSSSTTGSAGVELTFTSDPLTAADVDKIGSDGGSVELFLEDDFKVPDSISPGSIYFTLTKPTNGLTGGGGRVRAVYGVEVNDGDFFGGDDDWAIQVYLPDLYTASVDDAAGFQGAQEGQTLTMVITKSAGIRNPSEEGKHSVGYKFLGTADAPDKDGEMKLVTNILDDDGMSTSEVATYAKISLSVDNGGRGKEVTITGSGFNNGTEAEVFVLVAAAGLNDNDDETDDVTCDKVVDDGDSLGTAGVGSDDKFSIVFTVHQDEFKPGEMNYICAEDSEAGNPRQASAVKTFDLTASISLDPTEADSGEEVTLKARDFGGALTSISLGPDKTWTADATDTDAFSVDKDDNDYTFDVPGGLSGVIQVSAKRGSTRKTANLTITPSSLTLNQTEVAPNQSIIISGSGFNDGAEILTSKITIDGKMLKVDYAGTDGSDDDRHVDITSSGQFTVTVNVWHDGAGNPALDADEYTIKVTDSSGYEGKTKVTISEPTVMVTPQVAGPRDFITISGANWPVSTSEDDYDVSIEVDDKTRTASIDSSGRFNYEYRLSGGIGIGEEHDVKVTFTSRHNDKIEEETTFSVPSSNVVITPAAAVPGQTIDLEISGMPIGELVSKVTIDGGNRLGGINLNTDRNGDVTITGIVVPYSEPGFYPVKIEVGTGSSPQIAIVQLEILAEGTVTGVTTALPGALSEVGDNLVRVFHFNNSTKVWTFYDPRPEFEGLNTLTELADGQPYWILVSAAQENVVLNGKTRDLTCVGSDCWNQEVW